MDIQIDIREDRHFIDVAPVVDREDFTQEVKRIRQIFKVICPLKEKDILRLSDKNQQKKIDSEIEKSRKKLYLPKVFIPVIEASVFRNKVTDKDYSPAYLEYKWDDNFYSNGEAVSPDETYSIVLSPNVRNEDVLKSLQEYRDQVGNVRGIPSYQYIHQVWEQNKKKPSIKKYRNWYHLIKNGNSYSGVAEKETQACPIAGNHETGKDKPKSCTCYDESTIRKGVDTYESLVGKTPTL